MRSAPQPANSSSKTAGRHRARHNLIRLPSLRTVRIIGFAAPAVALAGALVAYQAQPQQVNPVASSMAAYHLRSMPSVAALIRLPASASASAATPATASATVKHAARPASGHGSHSAKPAGAPRKAAAAPALACSGTGGTGGTGMLPYNYATIVNFLVAHGYTAIAAAGVAGNMYQESDGNPESVGTGGGGLIGWTPLPPGFVTGNVSADLQTQLAALLTYNDGWAQYIPLLNSATSAAGAADIYMTYFERPGLAAASNREGAAAAVAQACGIA